MAKLYCAFLTYLLLLVADLEQSKSALWAKSSVLGTAYETVHTTPEPVGDLSVSMWKPFLSPESYSFGYWLNGYRKNESDSSADQLVIETGNYGLVLDLSNLKNARFGRIGDTTDYSSGMEAGATRLGQLPDADLSIQLACSGKLFTAKHCLTGPMTEARRLQGTRLWESGRYVQHFDLQHLVFADSDGNELSCNARLQVVGWPDSLTLSAEITPTQPFIDGATHGVVGNAHAVVERTHLLKDVGSPDSGAFTLEYWVNVPSQPTRLNRGELVGKNGSNSEDSYIGFNIRDTRIDAYMNVGGGLRNRHILRQQKHLELGAWNHLALTYDDQIMRYYVNGKLVGSKSVDKKRTPAMGDIRLGSGNGEGSRTYGKFDQVRLWNRALSDKEIKAHTKKPGTLRDARGLHYEKSFDAKSDPALKEDLWKDVVARIQLNTTDQTWEKRSPTFSSWEVGATKMLTLNCDLKPKIVSPKKQTVKVQTADGQTIESVYQPDLSCQVAEVKKIKRNWKVGYTDIRNYDEFTLKIESTEGSKQPVPFMLYLRDVANITGLVPILCYEDGTPTGIPVQLSKNWHYHKLRSYLRAYALLPVGSGNQTYKLRIAYGFYGSLPSASHAQLSLVGYGGNGRWDQLAIGCWGETMCFDVDRSCVDVAVTDVRMLMARTGENGRQWAWTNAGWGGDWLLVNDADGNRHHPNELKTAYLAHGPCLTSVKYDGNYGSQREVSFDVEVQTLRTDDYARTFQKFQYTFEKEVSAENAWLFKMGRTGGYTCPTVAYGNADGLIAAERTETSLKPGDYVVGDQELTGEAPWWISFPGASQTANDNKGNGYRALVIRDYRATLGGKTYLRPTISAPVYRTNKDLSPNVDLLLTAPEEVTRFLPGDTIEMDLEWITLHRVAEDYYGPNERYREHLKENPNSWQTTYREAIGNDLKVTVEGGTLTNNYPIQIEAGSHDIRVQIKGGVGFVPIRFAGLPSAKGYTLYQIIDSEPRALDQTIHGNDFWQTDYDAQTNSFSRVYNLPLDGLASSTWILKSE